jgi:hypothetical protein
MSQGKAARFSAAPSYGQVQATSSAQGVHPSREFLELFSWMGRRIAIHASVALLSFSGGNKEEP